MAQPTWYLDRKGAVSGPHTLPELYRLVEIGSASLRDMVQEEGKPGWNMLSEVIRRTDDTASPRRGDKAPEPSSIPAPGRANYLLRHWRGDLSLGVSYWVNLVLLSVVLTMAARILGETGAFGGGAFGLTALLLTAFLIATLAIYVWQAVGTWRSSDRHVARGGRRGWAIAAKVMLFLGLLRAIAEFGIAGVAAFNAWTHAAVMSRLPYAEFRSLRGGTEIEFAGGIRPGAAERLRVLLEETPRAWVIHLKSPGGDMAEGHAMAALVRARGIVTYVRDSCLSACTTVFLAGRDRLLKEGAQLGFHAPTTVAVGSEGARLVAAERRAMTQAGVPEWFVARAFAAQGTDMWYPTVADLTAARIVTHVTDGRHLSPGRPNPQAQQADIENSLRRDILAAAIEAADPLAFRDMAREIQAVLNDGGTTDDGTAAVERAVTPLFVNSLKVLPDRQIVAAVRTLAETARHLGASDARICRDWLLHRPGQPVPAISAHITAQQRQALAQMMASAVTTAADPRQRAMPPLREPPQLQQLMRRLLARLPYAQAAVFEAPEGTPHPPAVVCAATTELFGEILRLPERDAGPLLRYMLANG